MKVRHFVVLLFLALAICSPLLAQKITVDSAEPSSTVQGTVNLNVTIKGRGFAAGSKAEFLVTGSSNPGGVIVNNTTFIDSRTLVANLDVEDAAVISNYDIAVTSNGRTGKGIEKFSVQQKPGGGGTTPPPNPVIVFPTVEGVDVMNEDFTNQTTVWVDDFGGKTGGKWIPGTDWIFFAEYDRTEADPIPQSYLYQRVQVGVENGQVVGSPPILLFETEPNTYKPSWHWGPGGNGEVLYYRALDAGYTLEIVDVGLCEQECNPGPAKVLYQSSWEGLNWPIRSADGNRVWAIEYGSGQERVVEIDLANGNSFSVVRDLVVEAGGGSMLASARTFNGFAYKNGTDVYIYDADTLQHSFVTSDANPLTFSPDDSILAVAKFGRSKGKVSYLSTNFIHLLGRTPVAEETIANWTASLDWKH